NSTASSIRIDGSFEDWQGVERTTKERNFGVPENIDIEEYATAETGKNVAFYAKVYGNLLAGDGRYIVEAPSENPVYVANQRETAIPNANGRDVAYVFVDTDNNPATGFKPSQNFAVGADKAIEIVGKNGKIEASRVLTFAGVVPPEWTWVIGESVASATNGKQVETMAGKNLLGIDKNYAVYFYMIDWQNMECKLENALRCENSRFSVSGLYLHSRTEVRTASAGMEPKGTPHGAMHINGNIEFAYYASNENWPGNGSQDNPYIIEGFEINANGGSFCIWIENTSVYFVVRSCNLYNATDMSHAPYGAGIALNNVRNGKIEGNVGNTSWYGIYLYGGSSSNTITGNNVSISMSAYGETDASLSVYAICVVSSDYNNITNNNVSCSATASASTSSDELSWVTAQANSYGIRIASSNCNNITNNSVYSSATASANAQFGTATATANSYGIHLSSSSDNNITSNNISSSATASSFITLDVSSATANSYGIYSTSSTNSIVDNNVSSSAATGAGWDGMITSIANSYGIYLTFSTGNYITNNCRMFGSATASAGGAETTTIANGYGLFLSSSSSNTIRGNNISGSTSNKNIGYGIYLESSSSSNTIMYNDIANNSYYGVYITSGSVDNSFHHNRFIRNNYAGKGVNGGCQAYDNVGSNSWNLTNPLEGNAWSNWNGRDWGSSSAYPIDGGKGASDWYPLRAIRGPIHIASNAEFTLENGVVAGSGTQSDPYIIANWEINGMGGSYCIWIEYTDAYFVIRNCNVYNAGGTFGAGILLAELKNGIIEYNKCNNSLCGLSISGSTGCKIIANDLINNPLFGVYINSCHNNNLSYNNISGSLVFGIDLFYSDNNMFYSNHIYNNNKGIYFERSCSNNLTFNTIYSNTDYGIDVRDSSVSNYIHHNNFTRNAGATRGINGACQAYDEVGVNYWYSPQTHEGNYWSNWDGKDWGTPSAYPIAGGVGASDWYPLGSSRHWPIHITNNAEFTPENGVVGGTGTQMNPYIIDGWEIDGMGGGYCIWIENTDAYFIIRNCTLYNATNLSTEPYGIGIALKHVQNGTVEESSISGNNEGVYFYSSKYNSILNNSIVDNLVGVDMMGSSQFNTVWDNNISNNSYYGIYSWASSNNQITYNRVCNNTNYGIYISGGSTGNYIYHNYFIGNNGASKGVSGNCQGFDSVGGNFWYNESAQEGNYWSNWDGNNWGTANAYPIDGSGGASDWYPLCPGRRGPLHINGDSEFANYAANEYWPGNGTSANPYVIEGYEINANGGAYCIWIENVTVFFIIRNCTFSNATNFGSVPNGAGIALNNVTHGVIDNSTCTNSRYGIYLYGGSSSNNITNNKVSGNTYDGIRLSYSTNNSIVNNNATGNGNGIYVSYSSNNTVANNNVSGNNNGIYLSSSIINNITSNNVSSNTNSGIYLSSSSNNYVITNNIRSNSNNYGIYLDMSSNANNIINNYATGSYYGIYIESSNANNIVTNNASGNLDTGIYLLCSNHNNIINNTASSNAYYGICLETSSYNDILTNSLFDNPTGIYLQYASCYNAILYNWLCNNANYGVYIASGSTNNHIHHNNFIGNNGASKGVSGNCQACDDVVGNFWYDNTAQEGNYWSNWDYNNWGDPEAYPIAGGAGASDRYPLGSPVVSEASQFVGLALLALGLFLVFGISRRNQRTF
ncbi:MAG: NosD domain-containing protein, partial [Thermoplasmata archaeon]